MLNRLHINHIFIKSLYLLKVGRFLYVHIDNNNAVIYNIIYKYFIYK